MKFDIIEKGNFKYNDFDKNEHAIHDIDYEVLKEKNSQKHFICAWHNGNSEMTEIPLEIFSTLEYHLESELLVVHDLLENKETKSVS